MSSKLIVALDFNALSEAWELLDQLDPACCAVKVGSELFSLLGPDFVRSLVARQFRVFLDLKFHDIPNTVARACRVCCELGVWMLNVHAAGGYQMLEAARDAVHEYGQQRPLLIAVTVLTSMDASDFAALGIQSSLGIHVNKLAALAKTAGLDGVVSSALEVPMIKTACGQDFLTVTPGIRLAHHSKDDQARIMTPGLAIASGSDFIVVGRPITQAANPREVIEEILRDAS